MGHHIKQELSNIEIPVELHERSKLGVRKAKSEMGSIRNRSSKKRWVIAGIAACLVIPTSAFAYQALLVDDIYGSFDNLKKHGIHITMEGYLLANAKLNQAKGNLGKEEFKQFKDALHVITNAKIEYGDKNGNIDYSQVPAEQLEKMKVLLSEIQPYFDKIKGLPSSKEVLTTEEYEKYMQTLITYETIQAKLGLSSIKEINAVPAEFREEFSKARDYLTYVYEKQAGN